MDQELIAYLDERFNAIDQRFEQVDKRFEQMESRLDNSIRHVRVEIEGFEFVPSTVTIQEGGKVIWINRDSTEHTATLDDGSFDSGVLAEGKLKSESFKQPGTYAYHCALHPDMTGTVEVVAAG